VAVGAIAFAWLVGGGAWAQPAGESLASDAQTYDFLKGTQWYVPPATLPAVQMNLQNDKIVPLADQTVWNITGSDHGYFWGRSVAVIRPWESSLSSGNPSCSRLLGSVTPDGQVYITFVDSDQKTTVGAVRGIGTLKSYGAAWRFQMQMSTGATGVVAHWSYMLQCKAGQPCETKLPGSNLSLAQFLAQCP
jgi:hypothetical protein